MSGCGVYREKRKVCEYNRKGWVVGLLVPTMQPVSLEGTGNQAGVDIPRNFL